MSTSLTKLRRRTDFPQDQTMSCGDGQLLLIGPGEPCKAFFGAETDSALNAKLPASALIVGCTPRTLVRLEGERTCQIIDENRLCRMMAFLDAALPVAPGRPASRSTFCVQEIPEKIGVDGPSATEHWLTLEIMQGNDNALVHHLRRLEAYTLIAYLLQAPGNSAHLNELCVRYGLSYSHFRRLCHRALGCPVKPQLREWRAARTMLDLMITEYPVLAIALENGYASASHISKEIKQLFGITPRMAKNARALLP